MSSPTATTGANEAVAALIERSNRLGADPRNTNYAGGNTSAKGTAIDPVTGAPVELLWVKGSGGDLGTLTEAGLAVLRLDRLRALVDVYPGVEREDEMVAAFDFCLHGRGGAAPSIDTAMHGLVEAGHVDHLHPDSGIALATAADGEALTRRCFGDRVAWVDWRRPGFQLGLDIAAIRRANPGAIGVILGGHGITAWGDTSDECEARSLEIIGTAERFIAEHGRPEPFGPALPGYEALPEADRHARAAAILPLIRGLASTDQPQVGHYTDSRGRARLPRAGPSTRAWPRWGPPARTTSCGPRSGRWSSTCHRAPSSRPSSPGCASSTPPTARTYARVLRPPRDAGQSADARRRPGHRPRAGRRHVLVRGDQADRPGRGRVLRQRDQRHARRRGALDATRRSTRPRSSGSSTGRSRRPSSGGCPGPGRSPRGSPW